MPTHQGDIDHSNNFAIEFKIAHDNHYSFLEALMQQCTMGRHWIRAILCPSITYETHMHL